MRMADKQYFGACGNVSRYNALFSVFSIQNAVRKCRAKGGLNGNHIRYVLKQACLPTDGSVKQLRARIRDNLGTCMRPFVPYHMYPRTDLDKLYAHNAKYGMICARQREARERQLAAEHLTQLGPRSI